jgi:hypothetical protein
VAAGEFSACLLVWLCRGIYVYWNNVKIINFLAAWIPFALATLLAFMPDHHMSHPTKKWIWRIGVMTAGFIWSAVLWHQQVVADQESQRAQQQIVDQAVAKSNQHADEYLGALRGDLTKEIDKVQSNIGQQVGQTITESTSRLNESIGKVGKPEPTPTATILFSLWPFSADMKPTLSGSASPDKDGNFPVSVTFTNSSLVTAASKVDVWIQLCDACEFATEPDGFDKPPGTTDRARHRQVDLMNPGTIYPKTSFKLRTTRVLPHFLVGFTYSCAACGSHQTQEGLQIATIRVVPMLQ